ncbi:MAG: hypothetical protein ACRDP6_47355 [Actinoallomurus sp.]
MTHTRLATELVSIVRDEGAASIERFLAKVPDLRVLAVALAAMVPDDARPSELLAWTERLIPDAVDPPLRDQARLWTEAAVRRHHSAYKSRQRAGYPIDELTEAGHQEYQRRRMARTRLERGAA